MKQKKSCQLLDAGQAHTHTIDIYAKACTFTWSTAADRNSVNAFGARYAFFQDCIAACSRKDGFNYTAYNIAGTLKDAPLFTEVDSVGFAHGINGPAIAGVNNASTAHTGAKGVRIGGTYYDCDGTPVADVQTGTRSANYSCTAYGSTAAEAVYNAAWAAQQAGAEMWLYDCQGFDATNSVYAVTGATVRADASELDTQAGGGTIIITNPS